MRKVLNWREKPPVGLPSISNLSHRWETRVHMGAHPLAYPLIRGIARLGPAVRVPKIGVVVSDAALAREVLTDTKGFTKTGPGSPADLWTPVVGPSVLLNMEGSAHTELRRKLADLFTSRAVARICARVTEEPLAHLQDVLARGQKLDLVTLAQEIAGAVIRELVGMPLEDTADRSRFTRAFALGNEVTSMVRLGRPKLTSNQVQRGRAALAELTEPAARAFRAGDSSTVPGRMRELGLTESEALGAVAAFVLTGTETLVSYIPRLIALAHDTGWLDYLVDNPTRTEDVIGEALRFTVPSPVMLRSVAEPGKVGSQKVLPGDRIVIATISAAKDYGPFDPDQEHPPALRRLWFGSGPHFCLGMPLAQEEIRAVLDSVLEARRRNGPLSIVDRRVAHRVLIPGYRKLAIRHG